MSKGKKVSRTSRRFGPDELTVVDFEERIFIYDKNDVKRIGFIAVKRNLQDSIITGYVVNLVSLPEYHFCNGKDMRLLGFDTKWHDGKIGDCHRHCVCRGKIVIAMEGDDCCFSKIIDTFFAEVVHIGTDLDWDMEESEEASK